MAFPGDYSKYQEVTIDASHVDADLTDFVVYINLADLSKAGADIFDTCRSDGGDIRVTKSDGTTELAREVVAIDTTAKTGELHVKYTGTLSSSTDTVIRIYYNGTDTEPAASATYGSEAVWSDYEHVYHMEAGGEDSAGNGDATANGNVPTNVAGKVGGAQDLDGTDDFFDAGDQWDSANGLVQMWYKPQVFDAVNFLFSDRTASGDYLQIHTNSAGTIGTRMRVGGSSKNINPSDVFSTGTYFMLHYKWGSGGIELFLNGATKGTESYTGTWSGNSNMDIGQAENYADFETHGDVDEVRYRSSVPSNLDEWIDAEHTNQNTPSTFYSTGDEVSGSSTETQTVTAKARVQAENTRTLTAKAKVQKTVGATVTARAKITGTVTSTIQAKANVQKTQTATLTAKASIATNGQETVTAKASIFKENANTISAKGRVVLTQAQTVEVKASIQKTSSNVITAQAKILKETTNTITARASLNNSNSQTVQSKASIQKTTERAITAQAKIVNTVVQTISARAKIFAARYGIIIGRRSDGYAGRGVKTFRRN